MTMDSSHAPSSGGRDLLRKLNDRALCNVLSFLPADEAARAALLSSRWRHVFAAVHTVSLEEPESAIPDYDNTGGYSPTWKPPPDPNAPPPFYSVVSAALIARQRRRGAVPLRALRVAVECYGGRLPGDSLTVDQWVSYAVQQAAADEGLDLDLRLWCRLQICSHHYALRRRGQQQQQHEIEADVDGDHAMTAQYQHRIPSSEMDVDDAAGSDDPNDSNDDDSSTVVSSSDDERNKPYNNPWSRVEPEYTVTRVIFNCAHLRSLSLSSCRLAPPDTTTTISLPSLTTLLLSRVSDPGSDVERLVGCCPRLADLTLEACGAVC